MIDFTIHRTAILPALTRAGRVVQSRNTIPILANAFIEVSADGVRVTATDLEMTATATAEPSAVKQGGTFTAPMKTLRDFVSRLPESAEIAIRVDETQAKLSAGRARLSVGVLPPADFPPRPEQTFAARFDVPGRDLASILEATGFAASTEEVRFYLQGVFLHCLDGRLCGVATDGARLARFTGPAVEGAAAMPARFGTGIDGKGLPGVIVPARAVDELARLGNEAGADPVTLSVGEREIRAAVDGWEVSSRIIDGTYPDFMRIMPEGNPNIFTARLPELLPALERAMLAASEKGDGIHLNFGTEGVRLAGRNMTANSATEDEVSGALDGKEVAIGFSARLLASILARVGAKETVRFELNDAVSPACILRDGADDFRAVLMPMRMMKPE